MKRNEEELADKAQSASQAFQAWSVGMFMYMYKGVIMDGGIYSIPYLQRIEGMLNLQYFRLLLTFFIYLEKILTLFCPLLSLAKFYPTIFRPVLITDYIEIIATFTNWVEIDSTEYFFNPKCTCSWAGQNFCHNFYSYTVQQNLMYCTMYMYLAIWVILQGCPLLGLSM